MATGAENSSKETHLYLIRHGQAVVNVTSVMGGPKGDTGLTALGVRQAELLRDRLIATCEIRADVLLASTLPRARQTAEIIAPALGLPIDFDDDLQELRVGPEADGLPLEEYIARFGWVDLSTNPLTPVDPQGESWATFMLRIAITLDRIARTHAGKTVVIVCHGGVIDGSFVHFFGMNAHAMPQTKFHTLNTSLTHWKYCDDRGTSRWRLAYYNDVHHLSGLDAEPIATKDSPPAPVPTETLAC